MFSLTRIISGLVMIFAVILIALIDNLFLNFLIFFALLYFAFDEAKRLFNLPNASFTLVALAYLIGTFYKEAFLCGILLLILVLGFLAYKKAVNLNLVLIYIYPTLPILALWQLYLDQGIFVLFWLILIVVSCDSGAYFIGKFIGNTPFSQTSPKKTLEGVVGGVLCAAFIGALFGLYKYSFWFALFCAFCVAVFAVIGDLIESYFKRNSNLKDSGDLIPGHGGVLDRIDSLIIACFAMAVII